MFHLGRRIVGYTVGNYMYIYMRIFGSSKIHLAPSGLGCCPYRAVVLELLIGSLWDSVIVLCNVVRYFVSILVLQSSWLGKRELVALLCLSPWCLMIVMWLFLAMPRVCLQFVIIVFPDRTHLLYLIPHLYIFMTSTRARSYSLFCDFSYKAYLEVLKIEKYRMAMSRIRLNTTVLP